MQETLTPEQTESLLYQDTFGISKEERIKQLLKEAALTFAEGLMPAASMQKGKALGQIKRLFTPDKSGYFADRLLLNRKLVLREAEKLPQAAFDEVSKITKEFFPGNRGSYFPQSRTVKLNPIDTLEGTFSHEIGHAATLSKRLSGLRKKFGLALTELNDFNFRKKLWLKRPSELAADIFQKRALASKGWTEMDYLRNALKASSEGIDTYLLKLQTEEPKLFDKALSIYNETMWGSR